MNCSNALLDIFLAELEEGFTLNNASVVHYNGRMTDLCANNTPLGKDILIIASSRSPPGEQKTID